MILKSFGCSFISGVELPAPTKSWPGLISEEKGYDYQCHANPGCGNLQIMESVLLHASSGDICIINWTWIDRFDFICVKDESWQTLRPILDHENADYYYRHMHGQYRDILTNLAYIATAIDFLSSNRTPYLMTYMDHILFTEIMPEWHQPGAVQYLQQKVLPHTHQFEGLNFLDWSKKHSFPVSASWHPLEQAHIAAADYMSPIIDAILHRA